MPDESDAVVLEDVRLQLGAQNFWFDCRIPKGAITAVAGPSGSGKSTLLNLIAGFETLDQGRLLIEGRDVSGLPPADRPVSLVFQDNNLFAHLDLFTNVGLGINPGLHLGADERAMVSTALKRVGLAGFECRLPSTLSGGERQRAAFARALVRRKPLLLLDEPFAALDPGLRSAMADLLEELHRETRNTVMVITHDADEVARLAEHVLFVDQGRISFSGPVDVFFDRGDIEGIRTFLGG
ncbi:thiamine transport system ATP-binding protein [Ciceribacter lividus]|uniref:Thiamine transport system ATP-binding protein n=1 Tax=Ciceribacter lividus TaxID=1197950 RepID=A0A6I7HMS0_9HYPH|nr:ATP-binding cassette domain-containing protein [Ciceribacter lividus]RCW25799.1 thiamine transport system ATP-binding protein [Ciceribacter lividus]